MASGIDVSALTLAAQEVMNTPEFILEKVFNRSALSELHNVQTGIKMKEQIIFASQLGKMGLKGDSTCTRKTSGAASTLTQKYWEPAGIEDTLIHCQKEVDALFKAYFSKITQYKERYEIEGSDLAVFMTILIEEAMQRTINRAVWFGDKAVAAAGAGAAGLIDGANSVYYDYFDGLWDQIFAAVTAGSVERVTITQNAQLTLALQLTYAADAAKGYMDAMWAKADPRLKADPNAAFYLSGGLWENYVTSLEKISENYTIETTQSGLMVVTKKGKRVFNMETIWDLDLQADFYDNTVNQAGYLPGRALLTTPANIPVGTMNENDFSDLEIWYEKKDRTNNIGFGFDLDAKLLEGYMMVAAY